MNSLGVYRKTLKKRLKERSEKCKNNLLDFNVKHDSTFIIQVLLKNIVKGYFIFSLTLTNLYLFTITTPYPMHYKIYSVKLKNVQSEIGKLEC